MEKIKVAFFLGCTVYTTVTMNNTFVLNFRISYHAIMASDTP